MNESCLEKLNNALYPLYKCKALVDSLSTFVEKSNDNPQEVLDDASLILECIQTNLNVAIDCL